MGEFNILEEQQKKPRPGANDITASLTLFNWKNLYKEPITV